MTIKEYSNSLKEEVRKYIKKDEELKSIDNAIEYAIKVYDGVKHFDGSDYVLHALRTSIILTELHSDYVTVISGLFQNEVINLDEILKRFGDEVYKIVENLHKINKLHLKGDDEYSAIYLRKILVGLSTDVRVIIIKLAGRLDNLRYVYTEDTEEQKLKCRSCENVLIPIAHRLGINYIKSELEDLCLKYMHPVEYNEILENLNASQDELNGYLEEMKDNLSEMLIEHGIKFRIKGRVKSIHSLNEKLSKGKRWKDIYDILALRIIVEKESECYLAIGLIHAKYRPIPKRFKDYIAQPKENMYQSLHTGVIGPNGNIFEVQIRTEEMDEIAECGVASHWSYKENGTKAIQSLMEQKLELFRDAIENDEDADSIVSEFKKVFVEQMVYVFTPKGDVIELPEGSTPVDFAYRIHSHIGDTLVGALVNDQIVPIDYELKNDDIVKIKTNESSSPKKEWLNFVKTNQAKNKIKAYFSKQDREELINRGEELLTKEIRRRKWSISETLSLENIEKLLKLLKLKDYDELKLSVGSLRYTASYVMSLLVEEKQEVTDLILEKITSNQNKNVHDYKNDIIVAGCDDILVTIANCCTPVSGDEIVGFITKGNGITVHKKSCSNVKMEDARLIDVSWNHNSDATYVARLLIKTNNINNNLLDIVTKSSQRNLNIVSVNTIKRGQEVDYEIMIKVPNSEILNIFMTDLEALDFVKSVERVLK